MKTRKYIVTYIDFLNEQHEKVELYHGSNTKFNIFDDELISSGEGSKLFGKGYYLTDNIDVADFYADIRTKKDRIKNYDNTGIFKSEVPIYHNDAQEYANKNKIINTFTINGNILNVQDYIIDKDFEEFIINSYEKHLELPKDAAVNIFNFMRNNKHKISNYRGELIYIIQHLGMGNDKFINDIVGYIKSVGYDSLKYRTDKDFEGVGNYWNYVIYNKNIISNK